jgi:membrane protein DedA with SNARE-associated domain
MIKELAQDLVDLIFDWGYLGIFLLMSVESSFIPFPSELVLIPAGYLASQEQMNIFLIMTSTLLGSLVGAFINYYLALKLGRKLLIKYGKYFLISSQTLEKMDKYFDKHGAISTFIGRLIPGIRQLISIPAGLSGMSITVFAIYTALGAGIWGLTLVLLGYFIGQNQELIELYLSQITTIALIVVAIIGIIYIYIQKQKSKKDNLFS